MTIEYKVGDLLTEDAEALVNTVNCVGVMGRGIALQFKKAFPENFRAYANACKANEVRPGALFVFETGRLTNPRYIVNFPTKRHWRNKSRIEDIEAGLLALVDEIRARNIRSVAIPPLGSGLGGLSWAEVRPKIESRLAPLESVRTILFEPGGRPGPCVGNRSAPAPEMTPGRAALVGLMHRYLDGLLDPFVTLLEIHKLLYFLQITGEPLRLRFTKGHYGPYAENLRHVLNTIEGHFVSGYEDGGDAPDKALQLLPGVLDKAQDFLLGQDPTRRRLGRVGELVEGFESPFGLELLATVHWIAADDPPSSLDQIEEAVYAWSRRKQRFSSRQISLAHARLSEKGWLPESGRNQNRDGNGH